MEGLDVRVIAATLLGVMVWYDCVPDGFVIDDLATIQLDPQPTVFVQHFSGAPELLYRLAYCGQMSYFSGEWTMCVDAFDGTLLKVEQLFDC